MEKRMTIICLTFLLLNCRKKDGPAPVSSLPAVTAPSNKKYLALGDSYTIGQSVPETDRFPVQTKKWLVDQGINMNAPQIIATTGWTTDNLQAAITT